MSSHHQYGKDQVIFATKEDHATPSNVTLSIDPNDEPRGLILPNGDINWSCPCLGGMATGPCGVEFRDAFSCFHYSKANPKGSDCIERFDEMQKCMSRYPTLYPKRDDIDDEMDDMVAIPENLSDTGDKNLDGRRDSLKSLTEVRNDSMLTGESMKENVTAS